MDHQTLTALLERIQHHDEMALSALYDAHVDAVFSVALHVLGNQQDAEEVTQDVFLRIWHKAEQYDPQRGRFLTWLLTITRRLAIDQVRRKQRVAEVPNPVSLDAHEQLWDQVVAQEEMTDLQRNLLSALQELPGEYREVILLAYFRGMTHVEIAAFLGRPLGTVKTHIRQGMEKLRTVWLRTDSDRHTDDQPATNQQGE